MPAVLAVTTEELAAIHSIGEIIARSVTAGLKSSRPLIDEVLQYVTIAPVEEAVIKAAAAAGTGPLAGESFVFTGKMARLERKAAQQKVEGLGGSVGDAVSKNTTYLVIGDDRSDGKKSTKEKAADKLVAAGAPLKIITESDFLARVEALETPAAV
ncbi:MAG: hypothetical protein EOO75_19010 [Myxococcales bacterium]|nr:MAG: hypothetical protein EOO75_19010 [Myxococcales bacterium]